MFVSAVAKGRGVSGSDVRNGFAEGGMALANEAHKLGMVDRVATLDQPIVRLIGTAPSRGTANRQRSAVLL